MAKGAGIAGLVLAILSAFAAYGFNFGSIWLAMIACSVAAMNGDRVYSIASIIIAAAGLILFSPLTMTVILTNLRIGEYGIAIIAFAPFVLPVVAIIFSNKKNASAAGFDGGENGSASKMSFSDSSLSHRASEKPAPPSTKTCGQCNILNASGSKFCSSCGALLDIACDACGTSNAGNAKFCQECAAPIGLNIAKSTTVSGPAVDQNRAVASSSTTSTATTEFDQKTNAPMDGQRETQTSSFARRPATSSGLGTGNNTFSKNQLVLTALTLFATITSATAIYYYRNATPTEPKQATTTPTVPSGSVRPTIRLPTENGGTIEANDFRGKGHLSNGMLFLAGEDNLKSPFTIGVWEQDQSFSIALNELPLGEARRKAESLLLAELGVSKSDLCKLKYNVGVANDVSREYSARNLLFSFCPGAVQLP